MINGIGNKVINDANCGYTANAGNAEKLAENIIKAYNAPKETLVELGSNGRLYYMKEFDKGAIIDKLERVFEG
jgi:glycosyltransferase involved in cell wall biosynthesis